MMSVLRSGTAFGVLLCHLASGTILDAFTQHTAPVKIAQGELRGNIDKTPAGTPFQSYLGIPYAKPPLGDLRFKAPQPPEPWTGLFDATAEGNMCLQPSAMPNQKLKMATSLRATFKTIASLPGVASMATKIMMHMKEDCLFLNVYTPVESLPAQKLMPVLVYIHGGAYMTGSGDASMYGPDYLLDHRIVAVTINYRLGALGFLSTNTSDAPGNAGFKDQAMALRWVKNNIKTFGGDPEKVTIYGESAGSASVHFHVLSPMSKGLFRSAILSSSMAQCPYAFHSNTDHFSKQLAEVLGAGPDVVNDVSQRINFLREANARTMTNKLLDIIALPEYSWSMASIVPVGAVIEPPTSVSGEEAFLTEHPNILLREGRFNKVPMVIGSNSKEGSIFYLTRGSGDEDLQAINENPTSFLPNSIFDVIPESGRNEVAQKIRKFYFQEWPVNRDSFPRLLDLHGDETLTHGIEVANRWHVKHSTPETPVFRYFFSLDAFGMVSFLLGVQNLNGAGHADELGYVFKAHMISDLATPHENLVRLTRARMLELIANFVTHGNPTPKTTDLVKVKWPPAQPGSLDYLEIGPELAIKKDVLKERMDFWHTLYKETTKDPIYNFDSK